jgi:hypothetical protein
MTTKAAEIENNDEVDEYKKLEEQCNVVLSKIKERKKRKVKLVSENK